MPHRRSPDLISVIEAIYCVDRAREDWLEVVMQTAAGGLPQDAGVGGVFYRINDGGMVLEHIAAQQELGGWLDVGRRAHTDPAMKESICWGYENILCADMGPAANRLPGREVNAANFKAWDLAGCLMMNGYDSQGFGCALYLFSRHAYRLTATQYAAFCRIATHLSTAYRLQRRLCAAAVVTQDEDVMIDHRGRPQLPEGLEHGRAIERALADAFQAIRWARGKARREQPTRAVNAWRGLVTGRWTLMDSMDVDGRRYVLARENTPKPRGPAILSERERQVTALAALGRHNKLIAYELGLAPPTVRVLLSRAATKMSANSRSELIERYRSSHH